MTNVISDNVLKNQLKLRKMELEKTLRAISKAKKTEPEGKLRVARSKGKSQYYWILDSKDTSGKYIRKENRKLAESLAQKNYNNKLVLSINQELEALQKYLDILEHSPETIYDNLTQERKKLVSPSITSDETHQRMWQEMPYETDLFYPETKIYETKQGEKVRSKSEMMIADAYYDLGIPYRYEAKLELGPGQYKYPDFTALKKKTREIIFHEHFGLLDDEKYRLANLQKINQYQKAGIVLGKNLIVTYETEEVPFDIKTIRQMLQEVYQ